MPAPQTYPAGIGDHRRIVDTEFRPRVVHPEAALIAEFPQTPTQFPGCTYTAGDHQPLPGRGLHGPGTFDDQGIDRSVLESKGDISHGLLIEHTRWNRVSGKRL